MTWRLRRAMPDRSESVSLHDTMEEAFNCMAVTCRFNDTRPDNVAHQTVGDGGWVYYEETGLPFLSTMQGYMVVRPEMLVVATSAP